MLDQETEVTLNRKSIDKRSHRSQSRYGENLVTKENTVLMC